MDECSKARSGGGSEVSARWAAAMAEHEGLVHWVVRRQDCGPLAYIDAVHEGRIGLWHALACYDAARGTRFSSYAVPAIARAVWAAVARERHASMPVAAARVGSMGAEWVVDPDPCEEWQHTEVGVVLREVVAGLPSSLGRVVVAHLGLDPAASGPQTFAAIGQELGVSRQRVHQMYVAALDWAAQPARSLPLRQLLDRATRRDYQQTRARQQQHARARRPRARRSL